MSMHRVPQCARCSGHLTGAVGAGVGSGTWLSEAAGQSGHLDPGPTHTIKGEENVSREAQTRRVSAAPHSLVQF